MKTENSKILLHMTLEKITTAFKKNSCTKVSSHEHTTQAKIFIDGFVLHVTRSFCVSTSFYMLAFSGPGCSLPELKTFEEGISQKDLERLLAPWIRRVQCR